MESSRQERVVAVLIGVLIVLYLLASRDYRFGEIGRPGPGFFPMVAGALGLVLVLWSVFRAERASHPPLTAAAILFIVALGAFALLVDTLGFIPTAVLFTALMVRLLGSRNPWQIAGVGIIVPVALYVTFVRGFGIELPRGPVEWTLFSAT